MKGVESIRVNKAMLDTDDRDIIIQGIIDPRSIQALQIAEYQREQLSRDKISLLKEAIRASRVPTIELGMRGEDAVSDNDAYILNDSVFIVDGYQRCTAALELLKEDPSLDVRLSVVVHLNTTFEWELERFKKLNIGQTKLSGNITLRNLRFELPVIAMIIDQCNAKDFALSGKVSWSQNMERGCLMTGLTLCRVIGQLHGHIGPGRTANTAELARGLETIMQAAGKRTFVNNFKTFFEVIDKVWGIKQVAYRNMAIQLKLSFMSALARVFSDHTNFWDESKLVVDEATIRKLASFPMTDPAIIALSSSGGKSTQHLGILLTEHINKGRRTRHLTPRSYIDNSEIKEEGDV